MDIKINVDDKKIWQVMNSLENWFTNFKPFLKDISTLQLQSADESFKTRWRNLWKPWEKLKLETIKEKLRIWKNVDILQRTGKMRKSFRVSKLTRNELEIENTAKYFRYHQRWGKYLPKRQVLGHSAILIKRHEIAFIQYVLKLIQKWMM